MGQGREVCEIKCRACETKFIPLARRNGRAGEASVGRGFRRMLGRGEEGGQANGGRRGINQTGTRRYRGIQNRRRIAPVLASRR